MQPCGLFPLLSCSRFAFPSSGISGHVAPWQVYGNSPVGQSISKYHGRGRMDTKQKARSSSSVSRAGALVNPIFCTPDLERYTARYKHRLSWLGLLVLQLKVSGSKGMEQNQLMFDLAT